MSAGGPGLEPGSLGPKPRVLPIAPPPSKTTLRYLDLMPIEYLGARSRYYDARVPEPTVVILAAGEGTRMRSAVPKVLHPLCGRPLIAWPVQAARDAGAGRVIVVDNPRRRLSDHLPDGVEVAIQEEPKGTGDAVAAAASLLDPTATVVVINGDVALLTAEAIEALVEAHEAGARRGDDGDDGARRARAPTAASSATATAWSCAWPRPRTAGDATAEELEIREVNTGVYAFDGGALVAALDDDRLRQRPGRALPARRAARHARRRPGGRGAPDRRPRPHARRRRPRRPRLRPAGRPAPHPRGAHAQRRHDRRPRLAPGSTPR